MTRPLAIALALLTATQAVAQENAWTPAFVESAPAPLAALEEEGSYLGPLVFRGGLSFSTDSNRVGGLSGLEVVAEDETHLRFFANSDNGSMASFILSLDEAGAPELIPALFVADLLAPDGESLRGKSNGDAEGLSFGPDGQGFVISFERNHRIVGFADPVTPGAPQSELPRPAEAADLAVNRGMEALAALPDGRLLVGFEDHRMFTCASGACTALEVVNDPDAAFSLKGFDSLGEGAGVIGLYRRLPQGGGVDSLIVHLELDGDQAVITPLAQLNRRMRNMEGIAAAARPEGGWRIFIISDNGFAEDDPTVLFAFDWAGPA